MIVVVLLTRTRGVTAIRLAQTGIATGHGRSVTEGVAGHLARSFATIQLGVFAALVVQTVE